LIAVIGSNGQLGWELVRRGKRLGLEILPLDLPDIDIIDPYSINAQLAPYEISLIINASAYTAVDKAEEEPRKAFAVNKDGPANIAAYCAGRAVPVIHISTDYVYDGKKKGPYVEADSVSPLGVYGRSKAAGEDEIRKIVANHIIIRTAWLYGIHGHNFVKTMLRVGMENKTIKVVNDQIGCPTNAADLAEAIISIAQKDHHGLDSRWGTYHYCGAGATTWYGFAKVIFRVAKNYDLFPDVKICPIPSDEYQTPAARPKNSVLDCTLVQKKFDIKLRPWKDSLSEVVCHLLKKEEL
jgi:dTDP-4-dehydrorhamnose reductase